MREHASGDKQHKCTVCEKVFNYASTLRQHMLIHTGKELLYLVYYFVNIAALH